MLPDIAIPVQSRVHNNKIKISTIQFQPEDTSEQPRTFTDYKNTLPDAIQDLLRHIETIGTTKEIADKISGGKQLIAASDGSKKTTGGTYGWILETEQGDLLAEGMGPVHGTI